MIGRFTHWELFLARRLAEPSRSESWLERRGITPRRVGRVVFGAFVLLLTIGLLVKIDLLMSVKRSPWDIIRGQLTHSGTLLIPLVFFVLFEMRRCAWTWTATSLVAFFAVPWFFYDGILAIAQIGIREAVAEKGPLVILDFLSGGFWAMCCVLLFGACDRIAVLIERERAKQQAKSEQ